MDNWDDKHCPKSGDFVIFHFDGEIITQSEYSDTIGTIHHKNVLAFGWFLSNNKFKCSKFINFLHLLDHKDNFYLYDVSDYTDYIFTDFLTKHWRNKKSEELYLEWASDVYRTAKKYKVYQSEECKYKNKTCKDERIGHLINFIH